MKKQRTTTDHPLAELIFAHLGNEAVFDSSGLAEIQTALRTRSRSDPTAVLAMLDCIGLFSRDRPRAAQQLTELVAALVTELASELQDSMAPAPRGRAFVDFQGGRRTPFQRKPPPEGAVKPAAFVKSHLKRADTE